MLLNCTIMRAFTWVLGNWSSREIQFERLWVQPCRPWECFMRCLRLEPGAMTRSEPKCGCR